MPSRCRCQPGNTQTIARCIRLPSALDTTCWTQAEVRVNVSAPCPFPEPQTHLSNRVDVCVHEVFVTRVDKIRMELRKVLITVVTHRLDQSLRVASKVRRGVR